MEQVFVYGTLKKGHGNFRLLEGSKYLGDHSTEPLYFMLSFGGFPGVYMGGDTAIHGEVYEVSDAVFGTLDRLEGYPSFYNRIQIDTEYGDAWMYFIPNSSDSTRHPVPLPKLQERNIETGVWT